MTFELFKKMNAYPVINDKGDVWLKYHDCPLRFRLNGDGFIDVVDSEDPEGVTHTGFPLKEFLQMKDVPFKCFIEDFGEKNLHLRDPNTGCIWSEPI